MKQFFLLFALSFPFFPLHAQTLDTARSAIPWMETYEDMPLSMVQWDETMFDFGKINGTDSVAHLFTFKNTGDQPIKIIEVKPSCGCTGKGYTRNLIQPGQSGFVQLKFSPVGKTGLQTKSATVILNTDPKIHQLSFKADIRTE